MPLPRPAGHVAGSVLPSVECIVESALASAVGFVVGLGRDRLAKFLKIPRCWRAVRHPVGGHGEHSPFSVRGRKGQVAQPLAHRSPGPLPDGDQLLGPQIVRQPSQLVMIPSSPQAVQHHRIGVDGGPAAMAIRPEQARRPGRRRHGSALVHCSLTPVGGGGPPAPMSAKCRPRRWAGQEPPQAYSGSELGR